MLNAQEGSAFFNLESKDNYSDSLARVLSDGGGTLPLDREVIATTPIGFSEYFQYLMFGHFQRDHIKRTAFSSSI